MRVLSCCKIVEHCLVFAFIQKIICYSGSKSFNKYLPSISVWQNQVLWNYLANKNSTLIFADIYAKIHGLWWSNGLCLCGWSAWLFADCKILVLWQLQRVLRMETWDWRDHLAHLMVTAHRSIYWQCCVQAVSDGTRHCKPTLKT